MVNFVSLPPRGMPYFDSGTDPRIWPFWELAPMSFRPYECDLQRFRTANHVIPWLSWKMPQNANPSHKLAATNLVFFAIFFFGHSLNLIYSILRQWRKKIGAYENRTLSMCIKGGTNCTSLYRNNSHIQGANKCEVWTFLCACARSCCLVAIARNLTVIVEAGPISTE